jgi:hypothetical protein
MPEPPPRHWLRPPDVHDIARLRAEAGRRRRALDAAGCQTFVVGMRGGSPAIVCLCCGLGSAHPRDLQQGWCPFCEAWHSAWREE